jgi:hypothetical protein
MDGGTIDVLYMGNDQTRHLIRLCQSWTKEYHDVAWIPGRLYHDGILVGIGSEIEQELRSKLKALAQAPNLDQIDRELLMKAYEFMGSETYRALPDQVIFVPIIGRRRR